jgi:hypothetical protein
MACGTVLRGCVMDDRFDNRFCFILIVGCTIGNFRDGRKISLANSRKRSRRLT